MKSICLILPWFGGPFKNYFQFFLESCKNNPTVNWLIFTDCTQSYNYPENVKLVKCSFEYVRKRIQRIFDFEISLDRPYKLCDFKPSYGEVFQEELKNYDYWGYCDCDLIFGNIRKFISDDILDKYEMLFTRGHLHIFKNNRKTNAFFRTIPEYEQKLSTNNSFAFDEWAGISGAWDKSGKDYYDELVMDDIRTGFNAFRPTKEIAENTGPYSKKNVNESNIYKKMKNVFYKYDNGSLYRCYCLNRKKCTEEILYVHFQKRDFIVDKNLKNLSSFCIANGTFWQEECLYSDLLIDLLHDYLLYAKLLVKKYIKKIIGVA